MNIKEKLIKLASLLVKFATIEVEGQRWTYEGDFVEGVEVFIEEGDEVKPVADGEYRLEDKTITVAEGKITSIVVDEPEQEPQPEPDPQPELNQETEELKTRIVELEGLLQNRDAIISQLTKENDELKAEIENLKNQPKEEPVNLSKTVKDTFEGKTIDNPALKYFQK